MRIAMLYVDRTANSYYRAQLPLVALAQRGHKVLWPEAHPPERLLVGKPTFDAMLIHHVHRDRDIEMVQRLRKHGVIVVWDIDDDIYGFQQEGRLRRFRRKRVELGPGYDNTLAMAREAAVMTTPSADLAERYRADGAEHVEVIENHVAGEQVLRERRRHQGIVIGITAAREHGSDIERLRIEPMLRRLLTTHPNVRVVSIGLGLDLPRERYTNHRRVPIGDLIATEREFDIGIAPLVDSRFNHGRSNIKIKEYAAAGAMWLASPVGPYLGMGEAQGGLLVEDDRWFDVLDAFVRDHTRRVAMMERARAWAQTQTVERAGKQWESVFRRGRGNLRAA